MGLLCSGLPFTLCKLRDKLFTASTFAHPASEVPATHLHLVACPRQIFTELSTLVRWGNYGSTVMPESYMLHQDALLLSSR